MSGEVMKFDVAVVGSGPGGYIAAIRASQLGMRTAVIEREWLGGICLNWGCIPTKALLESARLLDEMRRAGEFGLVCDGPAPDWGSIVKRSRNAAKRMTKGVEYLMKRNRIEVIAGSASLVAPGRLDVDIDGNVKSVEAGNIIFATGARPRELPGLVFDGTHIVTYREAMTFSALPGRVLIVGAGAIGTEFAYLYAVMGCEVTLVELMERILPLEDAEVSSTLQRSFKRRGIAVYTSSRIEAVERTVNGARRYTIAGPHGETEVIADVCLVAVGVRANIEGLGLEEAGVHTEHGFIKVDDHLRTNVPGIWAIGDCIGPPLLAHAAAREGIVAAEDIAGKPGAGIDYGNVPTAVYCHPQVASVGLTEHRAKEAGLKIKVGKYLFRANGRAVAGGETDGFVKFVVDADSGAVIGVHIIGPGAPELLPEVVLARGRGLTAREIADMVHAHPTLSEAVMEAAGDAFGSAIHV